MAFRETCAMEERIGMLSDYDTGAFSVTELSERYGVSRETFYLWRERRLSGECDVVSGSLSCTQEHSGPDGSGDDREDRGPAASVSAFWSEEASLSLAVGLAGIGLAGAFDDRRHSGARRVGREGSAATSTDRSGRAGGVGSFGEQRVVRGFQRLVPHARRAAHRSVDGDGQREPLSAGGTDSQA